MFNFKYIIIKLFILLTSFPAPSSARLLSKSMDSNSTKPSNIADLCVAAGKVTVDFENVFDVASATVVTLDPEATHSTSVLTCAHVFDDIEEGTPVKFYLASEDKTYICRDWEVNPKYFPDTRVGDLALLTLNEPIKLNHPIVISLQEGPMAKSSYDLFSIGYGLTASSDKDRGLISLPGEYPTEYLHSFEYNTALDVFENSFEFKQILRLSKRGLFNYEYIPNDHSKKSQAFVPGMGDSGSLWFSQSSEKNLQGIALTTLIEVDLSVQAYINNYIIGRPIEEIVCRTNNFFDHYSYITLPKNLPAKTILTPITPYFNWLEEVMMTASQL